MNPNKVAANNQMTINSLMSSTLKELSQDKNKDSRHLKSLDMECLHSNKWSQEILEIWFKETLSREDRVTEKADESQS